MRAPRLAVAAAAALCLLAPLAACSGSSDSSSPTTTEATTTEAKADTGKDGGADEATTTTTVSGAEEYEGEQAGFYEVPDPLPAGEHGQLIRYEVMEEPAFTGATAYRIMYLSESVAGDPIAVTGLASIPTADAPEDGRPTITIAHGTTGIADSCSPSVTNKNAEMGLIEARLSEDFIVAATDYEGLGTPGRHPYLVGESEGRSTIDAALAAGDLPDAHQGDQLGIAGYSQGGHGALWANQVAAEWAPDMEVVGVFSGAPASEIGVILAAADRVKGFGIMVIAGINAAYPDAKLDDILTPTGLEVLKSVDEGCVGDVFDAAGGSTEELFVPDGGQTAPWSTLGEDQNAGTEKTNDAPVLLIHSNEDATVPTFFIDQVEARMCANGQVVQRVDLEKGNHGAAAVPAYAQALDWFQELFAGNDPTVNTCPDQG